MPAKASSQSPLPGYVLDSYAVLAYLEAERGARRVGELLQMAEDGKCRLWMCVVNLGEVLYIVERERGLPRAQETLARVGEFPLEIVSADRPLTLIAAHLKAQFPMAYADCFAAALAEAMNGTLVTGDPEFKKLAPALRSPIEWLTA